MRAPVLSGIREIIAYGADISRDIFPDWTGGAADMADAHRGRFGLSSSREAREIVRLITSRDELRGTRRPRRP
jgi:hypothetical protein